MQALSHVRARRKKRLIHERSIAFQLKRSFIFLFGVLTFVLAALALLAPLAFSYISLNLPSVADLPVLLNSSNAALMQPTKLYDRHGELILSLAPQGIEKRPYIRANESGALAASFIAALDPGLLSHQGAALSLNSEPRTLAEILAADLLLFDEQVSLVKTLRMRLLALQITQQFDHQQILDWSLNAARFGDFIYGAGNAANYYFGKEADQLSLAQAAYLTALNLSEGNQSLNASQSQLMAIQQEILNSLETFSFYSSEDVKVALAEEILLRNNSFDPQSIWSPAINFILGQLEAALGQERVARGGLEVVTSLDLELQNQIESLLADVEAELIVLNPQTGKVMAMIGPADQNPHAPGTLLTPFVYLSAFANYYSPATLLWDIQDQPIFRLLDLDFPSRDYQGPISARTALAHNQLRPALDLLSILGPQNVWTVAQRSGMQSLVWQGEVDAYRVLLDAGSLPLIEAAQAFAMLAAEGILNRDQSEFGSSPGAIIAVRNLQGEILLNRTDIERTIVAAPEFAYLVNNVLRESNFRQSQVFQSQFSSTLANFAFHSGAPLSEQGAWAFAYSPNLVLGLWMPQPESMTNILGQAILASQEKVPQTNWGLPSGLTTEIVCLPSGLLPGPYCPETRREPFLLGNVPVKVDDFFQTLSINKHSGLRATIFTPSEFLVQRTYMNLPNEAYQWAQSANIQLAPADSDALLPPSRSEGESQIARPAFLESVSGRVQIWGSALSTDFDHYRVLLGQGLYPTSWQEIGRGDQPVIDDLLARFQSEDFEGLYALQLQVLSQDNALSSTFTLINIDHQSPNILIISPQNGAILDALSSHKYVVNIEASDNIGLASLELILDGKSLGDFTAAEFPLSWTFTPGAHQLTVVAKDLAGNRSEKTTNFRIFP